MTAQDKTVSSSACARRNGAGIWKVLRAYKNISERFNEKDMAIMTLFPSHEFIELIKLIIIVNVIVQPVRILPIFYFSISLLSCLLFLFSFRFRCGNFVVFDHLQIRSRLV